jgi:hypothetical protein
MKTPTKKKAPATREPTAEQRAEAMDRSYLNNGELESRAGRSRLELADKDLPTVSQLSAIAATLAKNPSDDPGKLAEAALVLWKKSSWVLHREKQLRADHDQCPTKADPIPMPEKFPVTLDDALRLWLPPSMDGKLTDRQIALRDFIKSEKASRGWMDWLENVEPGERTLDDFLPSKEEVDKGIESLRKEPMEEPAYMALARRFLEHRRNRIKVARSRAGSKSAAIRKKPLTPS